MPDKPKPAFRRGGGPARRATDPVEWQHVKCADLVTTPIVEARYPGTCVTCLGRIDEGDEICPYQ